MSFFGFVEGILRFILTSLASRKLLVFESVSLVRRFSKFKTLECIENSVLYAREDSDVEGSAMMADFSYIKLCPLDKQFNHLCVCL